MRDFIKGLAIYLDGCLLYLLGQIDKMIDNLFNQNIIPYSVYYRLEKFVLDSYFKLLKRAIRRSLKC